MRERAVQYEVESMINLNNAPEQFNWLKSIPCKIQIEDRSLFSANKNKDDKNKNKIKIKPSLPDGFVWLAKIKKTKKK